MTRESLYEVERVIGTMPTILDANSVLKPVGVHLLDEPVVFYFAKTHGATIVDRAWAVIPKGVPFERSKQDAFAARVGKKLFSSLIAKRNVHYSVPHLHEHRLYVLLPHHAHVVIPTPT